MSVVQKAASMISTGIVRRSEIAWHRCSGDVDVSCLLLLAGVNQPRVCDASDSAGACSHFSASLPLCPEMGIGQPSATGADFALGNVPTAKIGDQECVEVGSGKGDVRRHGEMQASRVVH